MEETILETNNFIVTDLGDIRYEGDTHFYTQYQVHVKNIDCLDIVYEFENEEVVLIFAMGQDVKTTEGKEFTDFTYKIAALIENDIKEVVRFMMKHL
jgi:hypothetical protein